MMRKQRVLQDLILKTYGKRYKLAPGQAALSRPSREFANIFRGNLFSTVSRKQIVMLGLTALATVLIVITAYYYNLLVDTQQNMLSAQGNVDALIQRRSDLANNLFKATQEYSQHERGVFTSVVMLRSLMSKDQNGKDDLLDKLKVVLEQQGRPGAALLGPPGPSEQAGTPALQTDVDLASSLSKLMAIAEQYPDLKLSSNIEKLMTALAGVEKDIAAERIKLNDMTNIYTTNVARFPCNVFARVFGFVRGPYFEATKQAREYRTFSQQ